MIKMKSVVAILNNKVNIKALMSIDWLSAIELDYYGQAAAGSQQQTNLAAAQYNELANNPDLAQMLQVSGNCIYLL